MSLIVTVTAASAAAKGTSDIAIPVAGLSLPPDGLLTFGVCVLSSLAELSLLEVLLLDAAALEVLPLDMISELPLFELLSPFDELLSPLEVLFPLDVVSELPLFELLSPLDELLSPLEVSFLLDVVSELLELSLSAEVVGVVGLGLLPEPLPPGVEDVVS